jgi:3-phosphoshikimate 1-carboxyvinyltransferase
MSMDVHDRVSLPGDKSITHRALLLAAVAPGESRLAGLLPGGDCRSTAAVLRALGCEIPPLSPDGREIRVRSPGLAGWSSPAATLDCGNSGTTARLLLGLLAGAPLRAVLSGDASLRGRPMRRVTGPLERMGARVREIGAPDRLPLEIDGGGLRPLRHRSDTPSAQVKSAVLLAGLAGEVEVSVEEPLLSRDHTERMLRSLGVQVESARTSGGWSAILRPSRSSLPPLELRVPGDPSAAAFLVVLALLRGEELRLPNACLNPTRIGFLEVLRRMGARVRLEGVHEVAGEPVGEMVVRPGDPLRATSIGPEELPSLIDEIPILVALAARVEGETRITGAGELRVKETDRIAALVAGLRATGGEAEELADDGLVVRGSDRPLAGRVRTHGDHRVAMAFGVLGALPGNRVEVDEPEAAEISFPGFWGRLRQMAEPNRRSARTGAERTGSRRIVVAIDGPAGSGKSSTAKAAARVLGYRHLDSGAFYRALTWAVLQAGVPPERWARLSAADLEALGVSARAADDGYELSVAGRPVGEAIRSPRVNAHVSRLAAVPAVRSWLLTSLRAAGHSGGLVADGRDIGTVVFPDAELKVFLVCEPAERARRRLREQGGEAASPEELQREVGRLAARDAIDSGRAVAPLVRAPDAVLLDTTALDFDGQVARIVALARERAGTLDGGRESA